MDEIQNNLNKAQALFKAKKFQDAWNLLEKINSPIINHLIQKKILQAAVQSRLNNNHDQALSLLEEAKELNQSENEAIINIKAVIFRAKNRLKEAKKLLEEGLNQYPSSIDLAHNLSVTAADLGDFAVAEKAGLKALEINPKSIETYKNLGRIYVTQRDTKKAKELFLKLNKITPNSIDVQVGLGAVELINSNSKKAKEYFEKALKKDDSLSAAWANLGVCYKFLGDYPAAKKALEMAASKDPKQVEHIWNLSLVNLAMGNFKEGWAQYEVRFDPSRIAPDAVKLPTTALPILKKEDSVQDKTILLVQEQGFGDTIQFFRFAKNLKEEGAKKIIAVVSVETIDIVRTIPWIDEVRTEIKNSKIVPDYWVFSMSLPTRYQIDSIDQIPAYSHYLSVEDNNAKQWAATLGNSSKMRVGIVWAGRETHSNDVNRSLTVGLLEPIFQLHNEVEFISLQKGPRELDIQGDNRIQSYGKALQNFADSAGLLSNLDLLISVDSAPVHLAGALGMPVWTLIPSIYDFRWLINRDDSPWYPTMKLYRQKIGESWDEVIMRIKNDLKIWVKTRPEHWKADFYTLHPSLKNDNSNLAGIQLFLQCAFQYHLQGQLNKAELMYMKCLKNDPGSLDAIRNLAALYRSKGDLARSDSLYKYGEKIGLKDSIFLTNYANLLIDRGDKINAEQKVRMALILNPNFQPAKDTLKNLFNLN